MNENKGEPWYWKGYLLPLVNYEEEELYVKEKERNSIYS